MKKSKRLVAVMALSLLLTGCKEITAKPANLDNVLMEGLSHDINNTLEQIYKDYHDSSQFSSYVYDALILKLAEHQFKPYADLTDSAEDVSFKAEIDRRAREKFYSQIVSGGYTYRNVFDEKKFVVNKVYGDENSYIVNAGEKVAARDLNSSGLAFYNEGIFLPAINKTNFHEAVYKLVHIEYYDHYIQEQFVEDVYREKLVEKYIEDEQNSTLGRNYARKVSYIALKTSSKYPNALSRLVNSFVSENILKADGNKDLNILANAWRGVADDYIANEADLLTKAGLVDGSGLNETLYGDVLSDYARIHNNPDLTDQAMESKFTGSGKYPKEVGLELEKIEVRKESFVTSEWGIKNGGFTALPDAIRTRLFNIGTANGVDAVKDDLGVIADAGKYVGDEESETPRASNTFIRNIHGHYYLVPKTYEKNDGRNFLFLENDTYYIIQVEEAVNTAKLTSDNSDYYGGERLGRTDEEIADIVSNIKVLLGQLESNKTSALNFYLKDIDVVFHDEDVKTYFEEKFPEIFGEDADKK